MDDLHVAVVERTESALDVAAGMEFVSDPRFGGLACFVGRVRDHNHGRAVTGITYDVFAPLARRTFQQIGDEIREQIDDPLRLYIAHAKGRLAVGELAVLVVAATPHRDEAFRACRMAIERVKHEAPIWKQEHYVDGDSAWSEGCSLCAEPDTAAHAAGS